MANNSSENKRRTQTGIENSNSMGAALAEWKRRWRDPITLFTLLLVVVGVLQFCTLEKTDETLKIQQRAWLTPLRADILSGPLKNDEAIRYQIVFSNSGREPAASINMRIQNRTIDAYNPKTADLVNIAVPENTTCKNLSPDPGRFVIGPTGEQTGRGITYASIHGEPYLVPDQRLVDGQRFYVINGCVAYLTQGKARYSSFCFILESQFAQVSQPNSEPRTERVWYFVACTKGFEAT